MASASSSLSLSDRRALSRQYKEAPPPMGVYAIRNLANGRVYVDASANPQGALNRHRFELARKCHRNRALQQDWNAQGEENFRCEVIDTLKKSEDPAFDAGAELAALLALWRTELECDGASGYNPQEH
jgi:hypothetical protein